MPPIAGSRPRIFLTLSRRRPGNAQALENYRIAIERAGADVMALHPGDQPADDYDGLLLAGGGDVDPARYGQENVACGPIDDVRDELELGLARRALAGDLPILGICRGFQVLNIVMGGTLIQHIEGHKKTDPASEIVKHYGVRPAAGSRLAQATGEGPLIVNSSHHQAVTRDTLAPGLTPTVELDGIIEAFEAAHASWVVGVQWHPERLAEVSTEVTRIFEAFVAAAADARVPMEATSR